MAKTLMPDIVLMSVIPSFATGENPASVLCFLKSAVKHQSIQNITSSLLTTRYNQTAPTTSSSYRVDGNTLSSALVSSISVLVRAAAASGRPGGGGDGTGLTSLSNWDRGASLHPSMPPPDDSELSEGEVMVCRLEL